MAGRFITRNKKQFKIKKPGKGLYSIPGDLNVSKLIIYW